MCTVIYFGFSTLVLVYFKQTSWHNTTNQTKMSSVCQTRKSSAHTWIKKNNLCKKDISIILGLFLLMFFLQQFASWHNALLNELILVKSRKLRSRLDKKQSMQNRYFNSVEICNVLKFRCCFSNNNINKIGFKPDMVFGILVWPHFEVFQLWFRLSNGVQPEG